MDKVMGLGRTLAVAGGAVIGGVGAVMAVPSLLGAVGFTSAGITAGSSAASMMSAAATAKGGGVAAGGLVSILQSAGAAGLPGTANAAVACVGGIIGAGFVASLFQGEEQKKAKEKEKMTATAAAASDVDGAKVWWEERERKRREEEKMFMWDIAALAIAFCVVNWYLYTRADRGNRGHSNTKKRNQKVSAAVGL